MTTFMPPPPAATFLAFHPQDNNIIAIGMEDASIQIYNVRVDEVLYPKCWLSFISYWVMELLTLTFSVHFSSKVKTKLKGHQKRITGLAFSHTLNVLVSSGADSQVRILICTCIAMRCVLSKAEVSLKERKHTLL